MRTKPIGRTLVTRLVAVVVVLGGAMWAVTYWAEGEMVEQSCAESVELQLRLADQSLQAFFDPVMRDVEFLREFGEQGGLDVDAPTSLERLFAPLLRENPQVSGVLVADERGYEFYLSRSGDQWASREMRRDQWGDEFVRRQWSDADPRVTTKREATDYDPRKRPWFRQAIARGNRLKESGEDINQPLKLVHWTRPYRFFDTGLNGITAAASFHDREGRQCVVAFDVLLRALSEFREAQHVGRHGAIAFLDSEGWPIDFAEQESASLDEESPPPVAADFGSPVPVIADAIMLLQEEPESKNVARCFTSGGQAWWVDSSRFALTDGRNWRTVVVVPESDFVGKLGTVRLGVAALTLIAMGLAVAWAVTFSRRISDPIETLVRQNEQIARGNLDDTPPVISPFTEIQTLAAGKQRMRVALRSLMKLERDMEIARQIQQNTLPHQFPQIPGFQIAGWSEPADETGGDTFDVVLVSGDKSPADSSEKNGSPTVYLLLADASGHGVGPALCAMQTHSLFRVGAELRNQPDEIARLINYQLYNALPVGRFVTAWIGKLNPLDRTLSSFSAGQGPILWYHAATEEVEVFNEADGIPMGLDDNSDPQSGQSHVLEANDLLVILSDGIFEASDPNDEVFGTDRVVALLRRHCGESAEEIIAKIRAGVAEFTFGVPPADDQTALIVKCVGD